MSKGTYQKTTILGRLGKKPHTFEKGGKVVSARLWVATVSSHPVKGNGDEKPSWEDKTTWLDVVCFGHDAGFADKYLDKGDTVFIEARLENSKWIDKGGNEQKGLDIIASVLEKVGNSSKMDSTNSAKSDGKRQKKSPQKISKTTENIADVLGMKADPSLCLDDIK